MRVKCSFNNKFLKLIIPLDCIWVLIVSHCGLALSAGSVFISYLHIAVYWYWTVVWYFNQMIQTAKPKTTDAVFRSKVTAEV